MHIPRYLVVEDCGELINPLVVDGQIAGGVVQGIGAVLYEKTVYDDQAQILTGTFMDYLIPTAMEVPDIEIHHIQTPSSIEANYRGRGRRRHGRGAGRHHQRDRGRARAPRGEDHRAAPPAGAHPRARRRDPYASRCQATASENQR